MTLRVAHVLNSPGRGGVPQVVRALVGHLDRERFENHVFYLKAGEADDNFGDIDIPRRVATSSSKATAMTELVAWLEAHRIDILHTHSYRPNLFARMAGAVLKPAGLRIVAHYHNHYADKWRADTLLLERRLAAVTEACLAVSRSVAAHVFAETGILPEVLENGVDVARVTDGDRNAGRREHGLPSGVPVVGLIGRTCRQKGVDTLVDAAISLCRRRGDVHFLVVGDHEDAALADELARRVASAGLADRIVFAGHRNHLANTYAALDILAAPSRWEGFGLVLAEAMAAGVPVVASDVGGIPEVVGPAARLIPPDDPGALAASIESLLGDSAARADLITAGLEQASRFDWTATSERLAVLYQRLGGRA